MPISNTTTINRYRIIRRFRLRNVEFPVAEFELPVRLQGFVNGKVPTDMLVSWVDHQGRKGFMASEFERVWSALVWYSYLATGRKLTFTSSADVYRTFDQQARGWMRRMSLILIPGRPFRTCEYPDGKRKRWWLRPLMAGIACPGHSNHGWFGAAIDHTTDKGRPVSWLKWAAEWFPKFGYSWETPTEDWHVRFCLGDVVPQIVERIEECQARPVLMIGSTGNDVRLVQAIVGTVVDGDFGPKTQTAVMRWKAGLQKQWPGLGTDGAWDAKCWVVTER